MQFSVFFFSADGSTTSQDKYRLLLESAKFADEHGFEAVWTPERHFQDFGGLYPNPSVLGAALAMITRRVKIRAGSVVLPLHNPVRVAEEWAVVDNLSGGRVGVSFASGWHSSDFVLSPDAYENRKKSMLESIGVVQKLWEGQAVELPGPDGRTVEVRIFPRPLQPRLPIWITTGGSPETWMHAGEIGANVLTALIGGRQSTRDLGSKIDLYRETLARAGHDPENGRVTIMLHTFLAKDSDTVREKVREPLFRYWKAFMRQGEVPGLKYERITPEDEDTMAKFAFERYFGGHALLGTPQKCAHIVEQLCALGVNEIGCLVDFGVDPDEVMESLHHADEVRALYA